MNQKDLTDPDIKKYKTSDIALASTLMLFDQQLLGVEPINRTSARRGDIFHFVFKDSDERSDLVIKYSSNNNAIKVIPNAFRSTMRFLKESTKNWKEE